MIAACEGAKPESRETTINYVTSSTNGKLPTINENVDIYHKMPSKGLVMTGLNINSLVKHIDELRLFISDKKIDILAINEAKLNDTISDNEIYLPGFEIIRKDRLKNGRNGGGVCLYIRSNLNYNIRSDLEHDKLEMISIEIKNPNSRPFFVSTWYRPQRTPWPVPELFQAFEEVVARIDALNIDYYLIGDINTNFLPKELVSEARTLLSILEVFGLHQLTTKPTRVTKNSKSLIDLCITNSPDRIVDSGVIPLGIGDHSLVYMCRKIHYSAKNSKRVIVKRSYKNFKSENFINDLSKEAWEDINFLTDPNEMWDVWKDKFMNCLDKHAPQRKKRIGNRRSPWINNELLRKMYKRDFLKKKAEKSGDQTIWEEFKCQRNLVNNSVKAAKREYFSRNIENSKGDLRKTWKLINELSSRQQKTTDIQEVKKGGQSITSASEIAEVFNTHFTNIGERLASEIPKVDKEPESFINPTDKTFSFKKIQEKEVFELINKLDKTKATGLDKIPCKILKLAANVVVPSLTLIFNQSIISGVFPREWQSARVTPIFKKGIKTDPENYRPISVLPVVAKIFEKLVFNQFYEYLNNNSLLTSCQSGFRSLHSTLTALLEATDNWSVNIDNGFLNGVIFIDLKKAFDTIDHDIVLRKLRCYGADKTALKWFNSYLSNRYQRCQVNGELSGISPINCGVPQGSIIGPLLFLLYINDLPNCLARACPRMYADDTNITADLKTMLNDELSNLNLWLRANKLSLNITKTEYMIIGSRQRLRATTENQIIEVCIEGKKITRVAESKSLGVYIDETLSWKKHMKELSKKIASGIGALKRLMPFISKNTAVIIYKALIEPHFDYCSSVWYGISDTLSKKLQKLQNRAARVITKSTYDTSVKPLLNSLNWDDLATRRKKQLLISVFKSIHGLFPSYLQDMFVFRDSSYNIRNLENKLLLPKPRTNYLKSSISYSGAALWNSLPVEVRSAESLQIFKRKINEISI